MAAVSAAQTAIAAGGADRITSKGGRDLVTAADIAAEDAIRHVLLQRFPSYPVVGEERGGNPPQDGRPYWLVDPICGTRIFASGISFYSINVALVEQGRVSLAALGDGGTGDIYTAESGGSAWLHSGDHVAPIQPGDASSVLWVDAVGNRSGDWTPHAARFVQAALLADRWYVWMFGSSLALAYLAAGRIAGMVHFALSPPLHTAAGCLIAVEAGVVMTDFSGRPWTLGRRDFVAAATPELHRDLLRLVAEARPTV